MTSSQRIRSVLVNRTNADCSEQTVTNNRYHYLLRFEQSIGWDWLKIQITKASTQTDTDLEIWKIRPSGINDFEIEVRETARRQGIDNSQMGFSDFE